MELTGNGKARTKVVRCTADSSKVEALEEAKRIHDVGGVPDELYRDDVASEAVQSDAEEDVVQEAPSKSTETNDEASP